MKHGFFCQPFVVFCSFDTGTRIKISSETPVNTLKTNKLVSTKKIENLLASKLSVFVLAEQFFSREVSSKARGCRTKVGATIYKSRWLLSVSSI